MKVLLLLGFVALASARSVEFTVDYEIPNIIGYMTDYAIPLANQIREIEESAERIAGGSQSNTGQFPYFAGLLAQFPGGQGVCGGSLIANNRVLTAAHCWWDGRNQASSFTVVLGSNRLFTGGTRINSNNVVMHGSWSPNLIRNDVAVIRINSVGLNNNIGIVALSSSTATHAGSNAVGKGFGRTGDGSNQGITTSQALSHVTLPIITNAVCAQSFPGSIMTNNICTSGAGGRSVCSGDSGGPLMVGNQQVGIVSFGSARGCTVGFPAVFARVQSFLTWIRAQ